MLIEDFFICHQCQRHWWGSLSCEYLCEFSKKFEMALLGYLKVVGNGKEGGVGKVANDRNWSQTAAMEVCLSLSFAVVVNFVYFRFRQVKHN